MPDMVLRVAAKALIVNDEGRVLILREASTYNDGSQIGRYGLPGGRLEIGESFYDGLRREVKEETGLDRTATPSTCWRMAPKYYGRTTPDYCGCCCLPFR